MRIFRAIIVLLFLAPATIAHAGEKITVSAAISLKDALVEIGRSYASATGDEVAFNFGASGQLMAQIEQGAPVDVFISAADKQVDRLAEEKLVDVNSRRVVAGNALVLIVPAGAASTVRSFEDLAKDSVKRIAIGQPKTVPAGEYAARALATLRVLDAVRERLVYGANVRQVLDYVERGEVDAGIVYRTDALESGDKVKVVATADGSLYDPIRYPAVVVTASAKRDAAARFVRHLEGRDAQAVLASRGFAPPPPTGAAAAATTAPSP